MKARTVRRLLTAWLLGVRDGWRQPYDLSSSTNVDHLDAEGATFHYVCGVDVYYALDCGINLGQILRAGRRSEAWVNGYRQVFPWGRWAS